MPWFRVDDDLALHPKAIAAGNAALGLWVRAGAYAAQYLTEGFVPAGMLTVLGGKPRDAKALVDAGLWTVDERGWRFHQWEERQPTKEQVEADRRAAAERQAVARNPELRDAVRARDHDRCRYCGVAVQWNNRRGGQGGTYDHVDPAAGTTFDNLVVACRACNSAKGRRTPTQAGMRLLQPDSTSKPGPGSGVESDSVTSQEVTGPPARPGPAHGYLLTLVSRLAAGDAHEPPPAEVIASWQEIAGQSVDLDAEAAAYLARFGDRPPRDERGAWLGWLRKAAERATVAVVERPSTTPTPSTPHCPIHPEHPTGSKACPACTREKTPAPNLRALIAEEAS